MRILAARHACNHILVQELALHASLTAALTNSPANGVVGRPENSLFEAAEEVAQTPMALEEELTYGPAASHRRARLGPVALTVVLRRLAMLRQERPPFEKGSDRRGHDGRLPVMAPGRFVALYGPHALLPQLPAYLHDSITYEEASHHLVLLRRLLSPLGFRVSFDAVTRRGCPVGPEARFLVALTREATEEIDAARESEAVNTVEGAQPTTPQGARKTIGAAGQPAPEASRHADRFAAASQVASPETLRGLKTLPCTHADVVAVADALSIGVVHRHRRALQALHNSGYLPAHPSIPAPEQARGETAATAVRGRQRRQGLKCSARFDPASPATPPLFHIVDPAQLRRMRLHRIVLDLVPANVFLVRRFFHTGPAAFTAYVTLRALERGFELNMNGLFSRTARTTTDPERRVVDSSAVADVQYHRILLQSEMELFALLGMPYVDPIGRGVFCQHNGIRMDR